MGRNLMRFDFIPPTTQEQQDSARLACADNAADMGELVTFLSMLGLEGDE